MVLTAHGGAAGAGWNALQFAQLIVLFAAPWIVARLLQSPSGVLSAADLLDTVDPDWVALVAPLTGYSVSINDSERRLVWINESFTRLTGFTAADAIGKHTGDLLFFEGTDPGTIERVRKSFAARRGL